MTEGVRILVVEDNPVTRKMLRITLEVEGYSVIDAPDARLALEAARRRMPDLILQDLILPDSDGLALVRELRALPGGMETPIVAVSGFVGHIDDARTVDAGFTAMLVKPVEPSRLVESIRALLPRRVHSPGLGRGLRLVLVDDDLVQLKLLRVHLGHMGFDVVAAANAGEALRAARAHKPELVLSDVLMSETDGFQLCAELRRDPQLRDVPVVLLSAYYQTEVDSVLARRVGANALIARPSDLDELGPTLLAAVRDGAPDSFEELTDRVRLEHARTIIRQLDGQVGVNAGFARRCTLQAAQLSLLGGIADALSRRGDTNVALRDVLAATLDAAAISKGALFLRDPSGALTLRQAIGFSESERGELARFFGCGAVLAAIVANKVPVSVPSPQIPAEAEKAILLGAEISSAEIVPLVADGRGVGAIVLGARHGDLTNEDSVVFARAIGNQIVQSLELESSFQRLADSEQRYRTLLENAYDAIAVLTPDGVFREVNERVTEILGLPKDQIVGRRLDDFAAGAANGHGRLTPRAGRAPPVELRRRDGSTVFVEFSSAGIDIGGERLVFSVGRDVTEERRAQARLMISDRMASVGMLAAGVAHEINNPLAAVVANLDLIASEIRGLPGKLGASIDLGELPDEVRDAREASERVRTIVRDLRIFSRAEEVSRAPVDVHGVLDSSIRMAWNEIRHRAQLVKDYGVLPAVTANESRLGQVFLNLIVNAAQAIPDGHADTNEIRLRTRPSPGGTVMVEVIDTGSGIAPEALDKLFVPFFTTKPQGVGTGLGLAICHRLVTELGGEISASSELGKGTVFRVVLPSSTSTELEPRPSQPPPALVRGGRILVVDDEVMVGGVIRRALEPSYEVVTVTRAEEALSRITAGEEFDLILCDLMMPVMTGRDLYARLLEVAPRQAERIAFLTGGAFTPAARRFLDETSRPRLEKPFDVDVLRAFVSGRLA